MVTKAKQVKLVVFVPATYADVVRAAIGQAGAGKIGHYADCSFSTKGIGRFRPNQNAQPTIGQVGRLESVPEERIEVTCKRGILKTVVAAIKAVHPYEEIALDIYPLEEIS